MRALPSFLRKQPETSVLAARRAAEAASRAASENVSFCQNWYTQPSASSAPAGLPASSKRRYSKPFTSGLSGCRAAHQAPSEFSSKKRTI